MTQTPPGTLEIFHPLGDKLGTERDAVLNQDHLYAFLDQKLQDSGYERARACLRLVAEKRGRSLREDGQTPAILHELSQALYTIALKEMGLPLPDAEMLLCINFLHDLGEDYAIDREGLLDYLARGQDGAAATVRERTAELGWRMSKKFRGEKLFASNADYYRSMLHSPETVIAKCLDRMHNLATLIGAKPRGHVQAYLDETTSLFGPFLANAEHDYPQFARTFHFLDGLIRSQVELTHRLYICRDDLHTLHADFNVRSGFPVPEGLHPLHMIQTRAAGCLMPLSLPQQGLERRPEP